MAGKPKKPQTPTGSATTPTEPHPFALLFPLVEGEAFEAVVASIKAQGFLPQFPIHTYQGKVLEGWTRHRAAAAAGVDAVYKEFEGDDAEALRFVCTANSLRRHLTSEQKREVVAGVLKQNPELANNAVAKMVGVSDKTVAAVREQLEATSEIPKSDKRVGKDGRERPATQPRQSRKKAAPKPEPAPTPDPVPTDARARAKVRADANGNGQPAEAAPKEPVQKAEPDIGANSNGNTQPKHQKQPDGSLFWERIETLADLKKFIAQAEQHGMKPKHDVFGGDKTECGTEVACHGLTFGFFPAGPCCSPFIVFRWANELPTAPTQPADEKV